MRLGNHGFGMRDMLIYMCVLLIFLLFASYSINSLYDSINEVSSSSDEKVDDDTVGEDSDFVEEAETEMVDYEYYSNLENVFLNATRNYLNDNPYDLGTGIMVVDSNDLIGLNYLNNFYDQTGTDLCSGYSNVYWNEELDDYSINSYINCSNYTSEGY